MFRKILQVILVCAFTITSFFSMRTSVFAATENDLKEVMGILNADTLDEARTQASAIIASCINDKNYNELASLLSDYQLNDFSKDLTIIEDGKTAYADIMDQFKSGKKYTNVLSSLSQYETYYRYSQDYTTSDITTSLEKIDEIEIDKRLSYANALLSSLDDKTDIGLVGINAPLITNQDQFYLKEVTAHDVSIYVAPNQEIYAPFNGTVTSVSKGTITISSGATIVTTISSINTAIKKGDSVLQGDFIGTCKEDTIKYTLNICTLDENPLLIYGNRAEVWYNNYLSEKDEDPLFTFNEKDTTATLPENTIAGYITDDNSKTEIQIEIAPETDIVNQNNSADGVLISPFVNEDNNILE